MPTLPKVPAGLLAGVFLLIRLDGRTSTQATQCIRSETGQEGSAHVSGTASVKSPGRGPPNPGSGPTAPVPIPGLPSLPAAPSEGERGGPTRTQQSIHGVYQIGELQARSWMVAGTLVRGCIFIQIGRASCRERVWM